MPPGDIIPQIVNLVTVMQNMTNAAILYDDSFGIIQAERALG